jgi:phage shock protein PspC (stress-responsive transcriptional regulator)
MTATPQPNPPSSNFNSPDRPPVSGPPPWQPAPPAPGAGVPQRPQLRRSTTNRVLGGVCGGLADYSGVEALIWRIGFIALALAGAGIIVYPLLWVLLPAGSAGGDQAPAAGLAATLRNGRTPAS